LSDELLYENWNEYKVEAILKNMDYLDVLKWAYNEYRDKIVYACSFGAEGIVLIDLIYKINKKARIIFLDTNLHFPETYDLIQKVKDKYPSLRVDLQESDITLEIQAQTFGKELWKYNPNLCCHLRKVVPLKNALSGVEAWISGLRREQSPLRKNTQYINKDEKFQRIKICPLIHWTWEDVLAYIRLNDLPYNPLHDHGYPSIGCSPCTNPVSKGGDFRSGRWAGHTKTECGIHQD